MRECDKDACLDCCYNMSKEDNDCEDYIIDYQMDDYDVKIKTKNNNYEEPKITKKEEPKKQLNFDELILTQDIFEGFWDNNNDEIKILIEEEKDIYEKVKQISENKGIKEEKGYITIFILYYIFTKKSSKVKELKFVINKAKAYIKKIYGVEYEEISKEI